MRGEGVQLVIENEGMNDIMKILEALENSGILLKGVTKTIENETKEQKGGFLSMLLGTLGASLLGNLLAGGKGIVRADEGIVRAGEGVNKKKQKFNLMPFHPLTIFEISEYYKNEPRFNSVYSRDNLPKTIKKGAYVINLDEYRDVGTHWIALYVNEISFKTNEVIYFDSFSANDTKITSVKSDLSGYAKKSEVANDITTIKNDYVTNASLTSKLNDLKYQN